MKIKLELLEDNYVSINELPSHSNNPHVNNKTIHITISDEKGVHHAHFYGKEAEDMFTLVRDLITVKENDIFRREERNGKNKSSKFNSKRKRNRS